MFLLYDNFSKTTARKFLHETQLTWDKPKLNNVA